MADTIQYITRQREHHAKASFEKEYRQFVTMHDLPVDDRYLLG